MMQKSPTSTSRRQCNLGSTGKWHRPSTCLQNSEGYNCPMPRRRKRACYRPLGGCHSFAAFGLPSAGCRPPPPPPPQLRDRPRFSGTSRQPWRATRNRDQGRDSVVTGHREWPHPDWDANMGRSKICTHAVPPDELGCRT